MAKTILDGTMAGLKYKKQNIKMLPCNITNISVRSNIRGIYDSAFSEHGEHIDHDDYIAQSRQVALDRLKAEDASSLMIKWTEYSYDQLASGCDGYNVAAANALNTAIKDATPR